MFKAISIALGTVFLFLAGSTLYYWNEVREARSHTAELVRRMYDEFGRSVTISDLTPERLDMLLRIEDPTFRIHHGVDLKTPGAGMTTISQGLVKLLYFPGGFKPGIRKIRQTLIAQYAFDALVSKDEQLELYLNATYFGSDNGIPVHGLETAAQTYFGKTYADLSDDEFIALIGMTISPNTLKPGTAASALRVKRIRQYLSGEIAPASVLDVEYSGKISGTFLEEALMALLRVITDASPSAGN